MTQSLVRREAALSSRMEGAATTLPELVLFELQPSKVDDPANVQEVANYVDAVSLLTPAIVDYP